MSTPWSIEFYNSHCWRCCNGIGIFGREVDDAVALRVKVARYKRCDGEDEEEEVEN